MADRILDLQSKIKTTFGKKIEERYEENLRDVRLLLAKEYCSMLLGKEFFVFEFTFELNF